MNLLGIYIMPVRRTLPSAVPALEEPSSEVQGFDDELATHAEYPDEHDLIEEEEEPGEEDLGEHKTRLHGFV